MDEHLPEQCQLPFTEQDMTMWVLTHADRTTSQHDWIQSCCSNPEVNDLGAWIMVNHYIMDWLDHVVTHWPETVTQDSTWVMVNGVRVVHTSICNAQGLGNTTQTRGQS